MKPKILSWNVRGLNEGVKRLRARNLLRQWKANIICLQETKLEFIPNNIVRSLWGCPYVDWCYLASCGASGGMLIMWDKRIVEKIDAFVGKFVLAYSFRSVVDDFPWAFDGVYSATSPPSTNLPTSSLKASLPIASASCVTNFRSSLTSFCGEVLRI
jgi:hypothetical protein